MRLGTVLFALATLAAGAYLLWRGLGSGNPLFYFMSAVGFGMSIAAFQQMWGKRPPKV
jgi:hypothetical protein